MYLHLHKQNLKLTGEVGSTYIYIYICVLALVSPVLNGYKVSVYERRFVTVYDLN